MLTGEDQPHPVDGHIEFGRDQCFELLDFDILVDFEVEYLVGKQFDSDNEWLGVVFYDDGFVHIRIYYKFNIIEYTLII